MKEVPDKKYNKLWGHRKMYLLREGGGGGGRMDHEAIRCSILLC